MNQNFILYAILCRKLSHIQKDGGINFFLLATFDNICDSVSLVDGHVIFSEVKLMEGYYVLLLSQSLQKQFIRRI